MSGHSKWATTKRAKAIVDAKKGAIFTKLGNLITIAARKGGDPAVNFSLRIAIDKAKTVNMPKENVERAIKRGTGELASENIEELVYEGFGPAKSQFVIKCLTGNKNKSASEIRHLFSKNGGAMGNVMWNFQDKGVIRISSDELKKYNANLQTNANAANNNIGWEEFELELIDSGADDISKEEEGVAIYTKPEDLQKVKKFLEDKNIITEIAEIEYIAKEEQKIDEADKEKVEKFIEELENFEDIADYYTNVSL